MTPTIFLEGQVGAPMEPPAAGAVVELPEGLPGVSDDATIPKSAIRLGPEGVEHKQDRRVRAGAGGLCRDAHVGSRAFSQRAGDADETGQVECFG